MQKRMAGLASALLVVAFFLAPAVGYSAPILDKSGEFTSECFSLAPLPGNYCIHEPVKKGSGDVLYYLHGRGGSELTWQESFYYTSQIREEWRKNKRLRWPTVVSLSLGPIWLLAEKNPSPYSGLYNVFKEQIFPTIEARLARKCRQRILMGDSMGGFNSIQLALKTDLFARTAILCAPMIQISPFSSPEEIQRYVATTAAWDYFKNDTAYLMGEVNDAIRLSQGFFPTEAAWATANPLELAKRANRGTHLYVSIGLYDRYAAYEANVAFVDELRKAGARVEWRPLWGGHCAMDIPSLAQFLVR